MNKYTRIFSSFILFCRSRELENKFDELQTFFVLIPCIYYLFQRGKQGSVCLNRLNSTACPKQLFHNAGVDDF